MREEWHVYINIHLGQRGAARYRLQRHKIRRLRRRADYPHAEHTAQPSPRRTAGGWLRFVPGCLALTAVLFAACARAKPTIHPARTRRFARCLRRYRAWRCR